MALESHRAEATRQPRVRHVHEGPKAVSRRLRTMCLQRVELGLKALHRRLPLTTHTKHTFSSFASFVLSWRRRALAAASASASSSFCRTRSNYAVRAERRTNFRVLVVEKRLEGLVALLGLKYRVRGQRGLLTQHAQLALRRLQLLLQLRVLRVTHSLHTHNVVQFGDHRVRLVLRPLAQLHLVHAVGELERLERLLHVQHRRRQLGDHQHLVPLRQHVL